MLMIFQRSSRAVFFDIDSHSRGNGARSRHCRFKNRFFPFPGKRDIDPGIFRDAPRASPDELQRAKFRRAARSRLASRRVTDRQTDAKHENSGLLGRLRLARFAARSLAGRGPTDRQTSRN